MIKGNGQLVLQPTVAEMSTEELERHIEYVRARRIVVAMEYIEGQKLKLEHEADKARRKLKAHYEMLEKELDRLDRAIHICEVRVQAIELLRQEVDFDTDYS
jgi:hypothetical protein